MIPKECKRLAEVDFPIAVVSKHSAREKSIRHGHPSTLHLWWARRPLAACRAMLLGLLLPDPCDPLCPPDFKAKVRELLPRVQGRTGPKDADLRQGLLTFIGDFAAWERSSDPLYLEVGRGLVKAAHPEETPLVVDPFAGGGSIPLEALRLGCDAFASDLNPVACLILKVMLEDIPRHGPKLAEELRRVGKEIKEKAEKELAEFYPVDPDGARPIAYLWARTVRCESPNCGAEIPLMRSFWLCKKAHRRRALRPTIHRDTLSLREKDTVDTLSLGERDRVRGDANPPVSPKQPLPPQLLQHCRELRQNATDAEKLMWSVLRDRQVADAKFRRQHPEPPYILDFYCHEARLAIELDGGQHDEPAQERRDQARTTFLEEKGLRVLRFWNSDVLKNTEGVLETIWETLTAALTPTLSQGERERERVRELDGRPHVEFEIFEPESEKQVSGGTVARAKATCLCCGAVLPPERVRAQLAQQRGGADVIFRPSPCPLPEGEGWGEGRGDGEDAPKRIGGARMLAVVTLKPSPRGRGQGEGGRHYRLPTDSDYEAVWKAQKRLKAILDEWERGPSPQPSPNGRGSKGEGLCPVPDEPLPYRNTLGLRLPNYGVKTWGDIFSQRQNYALTSLAGLLRTHASEADHLRRAIALAISRTADYCSANCSLHVGRDVVRNTWARNALPIVWDFYEINPFGEGSGNFLGALDWISRVAERGAVLAGRKGSVDQADAAESPLPDQTSSVWFTDPPYYSAIGYAESSDFFYVWLKRALADRGFDRNPFEPNSPVTPKAREAIQDDTFEVVYNIKKDAAFFERTMSTVFSEGRRVIREDGIASIVFAHKTTEGWEALLAAILQAGWTVTASWPIQTEMENKVSGSQGGERKAMLLASVHLVCRPRPSPQPSPAGRGRTEPSPSGRGRTEPSPSGRGQGEGGVGDWGDVLRELPGRVGDWMERLQGEHVRGADLVFACIGPALEIFSRYSKVETAEGREVTLAEYLTKVWEVVGRTALEQILGTAEAKARNGAAGALEEDARLTALFLWTLQSTNGNGEAPSPQPSPAGRGRTAGEPSPAGKEGTEPSPNGRGQGEGEADEEDAEEDGETKKRPTGGFSLVFDVARRFAQPLGIHLPEWEGRIIETEKGVVRLLSIRERATQLFGDVGANAVADQIEAAPRGPIQLTLFALGPDAAVPEIRGRARKKRQGGIQVSEDSLRARREATTLDRVHAAMLLQASGRANALRALLAAEQDRGPDFLRLANSLSALYPRGSEEKRLLDAMLLAVPR